MLVSSRLLDNWANREKVLGEGAPHVLESIGLKFLQTRHDLSDDTGPVEQSAKIRKSANSSGSHLALRVLQEGAVVRKEVFSGLLNPQALSKIHDSIGNEVTDSPGFIFSVLLNVR